MSKEVIHIDLDEIKNRKTIVVFASDSQIQAIKTQLKLGEDRVEVLGGDLYELSIHSKLTDVVAVLEKIVLGDLTKGIDSKKIRLPDFNGSEIFYAGTNSKRGYKIISDEFSYERNKELYKGFALIEHKWRQVIARAHVKQGKSIEKPQNYSKNSHDHAVSMYELSDFFEYFLYRPASEEYIRSQWQRTKEKSEDELVRIAGLTQLDELGFGLSAQELEVIRKRRNQCMHFRVVTPGEYEEVVPLINKYLKLEERKAFLSATTLAPHEYLKALQDKIREMLVTIPKVTIPTLPTIVLPELPKIPNSYFKEMDELQKSMKKFVESASVDKKSR